MNRTWLGSVLLIAGSLAAQGGLDQAAARARSAWLAHDPRALLAGSPGVTLEIPGADPSSAIGRDQASELLGHRSEPLTTTPGVARAVGRELLGLGVSPDCASARAAR